MFKRGSRIVAVLLWGLLLLVAASARAEVALTQAEVAEARPGGVLEDGVPAVADWRPQVLPDDWARSRPEFGGLLWYRLRFDAGQLDPADVPALYVERVCSNLVVFLNGTRVGGGGRLTLPYSRHCFTPQLVTLPQPLLRAGDNTLHVAVAGYPLRQVSAAQRSSGLSVLRLGTLHELQPRYERAQGWSQTLPKLITAVLGVFAVFIGALWLTRRQETHYGYFTLWIGWWTLNTTRLYLTDPPLAGPWVEMLVPATAPVCVTGMVLFLMRFLGRDLRWVTRFLWGQMLVIPVIFLLAGWDRIYPTARIVYPWLVLQFLAGSGWFLVESWRASRRDFWLLSSILLALTAMVGVELAAAFFGLDVKTHVGHLAGPITLLPLCLRLVWQSSESLRRSEQLNAELERRVAEKSAEIERGYAELSELRAREAARQERQRIASDLHDDLGAQLLSIAHASSRVPQAERVAGMARQALDEMRLSVRGMVSEAMPAADALADWRAETVARLEAAGFAAHWEAEEPPIQLVLPARTHVQLTRILREAVSNAIRHSGGRCCRVSLAFDGSTLRLTVEDDGRGLDAAAQAGAGGHGLPNIERRVRKLAGWHTFSRGALGGARLDVGVPLDPAPSANMPLHEPRPDR